MGIEDETRDFLILIVQTISTVILWMMISMLFGIYLKFGLFENAPTFKNYIFYILFLTSLFFMIRYFAKRWKL
jgi:hypothetical protein